jgi:hypothetical protein
MHRALRAKSTNPSPHASAFLFLGFLYLLCVLSWGGSGQSKKLISVFVYDRTWYLNRWAGVGLGRLEVSWGGFKCFFDKLMVAVEY